MILIWNRIGKNIYKEHKNIWTGACRCRHGGRSISLSKSDNHGTYVFESNCNQMRRFPHDIQIEPVQNFEDFKIFYHVPFQVYRDDPCWVPPFWNEMKDFFKKKNPFWSHAECQLFIAKKK